jgi:hypothetical protein
MSCNPRATVLRVTLCCVIALLASGCAAIKGMLKPMVCDCAEASATSAECPAQPEQEPDDTSVLTLARTEVSASTDRAEKAANVVSTDTATPDKRTIAREQQTPKHDPLELVEPTLDKAVVASDDEDTLAQLKSTYPIDSDLPKDAVLVTANFDAGEGDELAVVQPGRRIQIFNKSKRLAEFKFSTTTAATGPEKTDRSGTKAVEIVRDGTAQILTHWTEKDEDGGVTYKVGVFKLIESYIGTAFEAELAQKAPESDTFDSTGTYEFLRGNDHVFIRWIPTTEEGDFDASEATVYKWNQWEGVYRIPKPPPTAPKREKLQTRIDAIRTAPLAVK